MAFGDLKVQDLIYEDSSNNEITVVIADLAPKANPTFTGTVTVPTAPASDVSTKAASTAFVDAYYATKVDPGFSGDATGVNLTLSGNLVVNGTTTTINTQTLDVEDINITLGKVSTPSDTTANNGGLTLKGSNDKTFNWLNATDAWTSSEHIEIVSGKAFRVNGNNVLNQTTLGSTVVSSSLTSLGTLAGLTVSGDMILDNGTNAGKDITWDESANSLIFANEVKAQFGQTTLFHNSIDLYIQNGVGDIRFQANAGEDSIYAKKNGAVELWHGNGVGAASKKFETTATGINVTGQINVNGSALSAAPEITATAHGTVTAEKAVIVRSDGKVETIANVPASNGSFTNMNQFNNQGKLTRIASNNNGQYVLLEDTNISNGLQATVLTVSGTTVTKNSATSITTTCSQTSNDDRFDISYDSTADKFVVVYIHSSTANVQAKTVTISGTGTSASISQGTEITIGSSVSEFCRVAYDPDQDKTALIADVGNDGFCWALTVSGTNLSDSSAVQIDEGKTPFQQPNMCYDNKNKKMQILWRQSSSGIIRPQTLTWDASNARYNGYSGTPPILWSNGYEGPISIAHVKDTDGYVCHYKRGDNIMYARLITCNSTGSTITAGSETQIHASYAYRSGDMKHDSLNEKMMLISRGTDGYIDYKILSYNVTNRTVSVDSTTILANSSTNPSSNTFVAEGINAAFDTTNNIFVASFAKNQSGSYSTNQAMAFQRPSTTLDATKFIGFASSTVTDGNTATVKVASNTSTQSSLTPAIKYYVQGDGTVGATASNPSVEAGIALSSTKLLIKG